MAIRGPTIKIQRTREVRVPLDQILLLAHQPDIGNHVSFTLHQPEPLRDSGHRVTQASARRAMIVTHLRPVIAWRDGETETLFSQ